MSKSITKAELEKMLAEVQERNQKLAAENAQLRQNKRPENAPVLTGNVTFPKGTGKKYLGSKAGQSVKLPDGLGVIHVVGEWKESKSSGNVTARITGWLDPNRLQLSEGPVQSAEQKAEQSFKELVVDGL